MGDCSQTLAPVSGHSVFGDSFHLMENAATSFHTFEFVRCRFGDGHGRKPQIVFFKISFLLSSNNISEDRRHIPRRHQSFHSNAHGLMWSVLFYSSSVHICSIISVKAKSFADREIRYTLKAQGQGAGTFNIGPSSGIVKLAKELDFEDLRQPHVYSLVVTATEDSGGFSTSVEVSDAMRPRVRSLQKW